MPTIYVNKSGSDANNGSTPTLAKLTMQAAYTAAVSGDTIIVGAGQYNEQIAFTTTAKLLTWNADGRVIVDGQNARNYCITLNSATSLQTFNGFHFRSAVVSLFNTAGGSGSYAFNYCEFSDAPRCLDAGLTNLTLFRCLTRNITSAVSAHYCWPLGSTSGNVQECTFDNIACPLGTLYRSATQAADLILRNVFSRCATFWCQDGSTNQLGIWDHNFYDVPFGGVWKVTVTTYSSLATWKAARASNPAQDLNSASGTPDFNDRAKGLYGPLAGGNLYIGPGGMPVGFTGGRTSYGLSTNRNASVWNAAVLSNCSLNGSGHLQLSGGASGTATLPTVDLGAAVRVRGFRLFESGESYPADIVDSDNTDVRPNRQTVEFRTSIVSQADCEAQAWSTAERLVGAQIIFPATIARWVQFRITLRSDGVAA